MSNSQIDSIDKVSKILDSNKLKISTLHSILQTQNNNNTQNVFQKIDQFLNGFEIDIKLILSLLDRLKLTYDTNQNFQSGILCCGCCSCHSRGCFCPCHCPANCSGINSCSLSGCNTYTYLNDSFQVDNNKNENQNEQEVTRNTSQNNQFDNINNSNNRDHNQFLTFNDASKQYRNYINKDILSKTEKNNEIYNPQNNNDFPNNRNNNKTYEYNDNSQNNYGDSNNLNSYKNDSNIPLNYGNNFLNYNKSDFTNNSINNNGNSQNNYKAYNLNNYKNEYNTPFSYGNNFLNNNKSDFTNNSINSQRSGYIRKILPKRLEENPSNFNDKNMKQFLNNRPDNVQNSSVSKSKRFQNLNLQPNNHFPLSNNYNENQNVIASKENKSQKKNKTKKINSVQELISKIYQQPRNIMGKLKRKFGNDIEERILNEDVKDFEIKAINDFIEQNKKNLSREVSPKTNIILARNYKAKTPKRKFRINYNPIEQKRKLLEQITDKQHHYREFPRGWNSTKEYFINNGTEGIKENK